MATAAHLSEHVPFHRNVLATEKGPWLIRVNAVLTAQESENASLHLVLEDLSHEPRSKDRRLYLIVSSSRLEIPQERVTIAHRIRRWVETSSGDGFLDLVTRQE
jgi:hypothetical protein